MKIIKKIKKASISLAEIEIQLALGTLSEAYQIAGFIAITKDPKAIVWASKHSSSKVRAAVVKNSMCSISILLRLSLLDKSVDVRNTASDSLKTRKTDFENFLLCMEEYPQLAFPFYHSSLIVEPEPEDAYNEEIPF